MSLDLMFELAWKSGLIAAAALAGASLLRARPASERVAVLRLGVVLLLAFPVLAVWMPALHVETPAFVARAAPVARAVSTDMSMRSGPTAVPTTLAPPIPTASARAAEPWTQAWVDPIVASLVLWGAGFGFLMLRLLAGVVLLHRWTRRAEPVSDTRWLAALARAAEGKRPPALFSSPRVDSPLSWGWRPAVIVLDKTSLDQAGRADAVLAHEMGHVRHGDWLFLMASRLMVALFWFNPFAWLLQRELARQSEQAADAWAAGRVGRADYASALVAMASRGRPHAALGIAAPKGELAHRVIAILNVSTAGGKPWRAGLAIIGCLGIATPLAAVELRASAMASPAPSVVRSATPAPRAPSPQVAIARGAVSVAAVGTAPAPLAGVPSRTADGVRVGARGAPAIPSDVDLNASSEASGPNGARFEPASDFPWSGDEEAPPTREQRRVAAEGLRGGARQIEAGIEKMKRAALMTGDPDFQEQVLADTDEMRAEAADLRREADAMESDG